MALALGRVDVDGMLSEISGEQLREWEAFFLIEPFGKPADDFRAGLVAAAVSNASIKFKRADFSPLDFMPREKAAEPEDIGGRIIAAFKAIGSKRS